MLGKKYIFLISLLFSTLAMLVFGGRNVQAQPLPIDNWAIRDAVATVSLSPNGQHLLILKMPSKEGEYLLEIYKTDDLSKPLRTLNADPMELISASWASDNYIIGQAWQVVRRRVRGPEDDVRDSLFYAYNLEANKFKQFSQKRVSGQSDGFSVVSLLPKEPDSILVSYGAVVQSGSGVDPYSAFRPYNYYKLNLETGSKSLVMKGNDKIPSASFDIDGNPKVASGYDRSTHERFFYVRKPGENDWSPSKYKTDFDDPANRYNALSGLYGIAGFSATDPNIAYVTDSRGADNVSLYEYNITTDEFGKKLFTAPGGADVIGIETSSRYWAGDNHLVAAYYPGAKYERHWFDMQEKALYDQLEQSIPNAHEISISSRTRDGDTMLVYNSGPKDPGTYYLMQNRQLKKLASKNPLVTDKDLSNVEFIKYQARDGLTIPAYVTKPKGPGPHPLVVMPHGGPHINEVVGYDEWGQFLANNGYMVLQPEYRMSTGWGQKHFDAGMDQHGLAMQDDLDDGAKYLVSKGWADPNKIAIYGWSYGGYAALVADSRSPNIYQCAIAGAAVADPKKVYLKRNKSGDVPKPLDDWSRARGGFTGINPINEVDKINIPLLMIHGDWDARVLYFNYEDYKAAVEKAGKKAKFVTLEGADHFYSTLMYRHQKLLYESILDFLHNDCGM